MTWPRVFHRIWLDEPERPQFAAWRDKLVELHPGWAVETWNDSTKLDFLTQPEAFSECLERDPFGRAPDLLRYELLWKFGGVYIDTDFEPIKPFDPLLKDKRPFAGWENERTMCTALLAAPPRHPAIGILLEGVVARLKTTWNKPANYALGPEYATKIWLARDDVRRMPVSTFYPVGWWEKELLGEVEYPPQTIAVHHWSAGWKT